MFSKPIFNLGYGPTVETLEDVDVNDPKYNLKYNKTVEESITPAVYTLDPERASTPTDPKPKVNGIMTQLGERIIPTYPSRLATEGGEQHLITEDSEDHIKLN